MSLATTPNDPQQEQAPPAFSDLINLNHTGEADTIFLSKMQQPEILDRDREYEAGETETYSLNEVIAHFNIKEK